MIPDRRALSRVIGGVIGRTVTDRGAAGVMVLEPRSPGGRLVLEIAALALGHDRVHPAPVPDAAPGIEREEAGRAAARVAARREGYVLAHPVTKTVLLLEPSVSPESLLPLGDLWASELHALAGGVTIPVTLEPLLERAGGLGAVDAALRAWLDERRRLDDALSTLDEDVRAAIRERLDRNCGERRWPRIVPKLGARTLWIDVHE